MLDEQGGEDRKISFHLAKAKKLRHPDYIGVQPMRLVLVAFATGFRNRLVPMDFLAGLHDILGWMDLSIRVFSRHPTSNRGFSSIRQ